MAETETGATPETGQEATALAENEFARLLEKEFKPKTERAKEAIESAVRTLAEQALSQTALVSEDAVRSIEAIIAEIDRKLSEQLNHILHHPDFQQLESAWRGLHYLVSNTETDEMLKIKVFNISKKDLHKTLKKFKGANWDQSPIFKRIYEEEYGQFGGEPYGCLVGDYYFDHSPQDVELLREMGKIAAASHCPFISGAAPSLLNMESWQELSQPRDLAKIFQTPEYAAWNSLRESEDSRYIGLTMPRFLGRLPYGSKTEPVEEFDFEEQTEGDHNRFLWVNSAYAMGTNITRAFKLYGWCSRIRGVESGGAVTNLPTYTFPTDDGGVDMKCPTEIAISDRREAELARLGLMPLIHKKNTDFAAFIGAQSLHKPAEYDDPDATANARLAARLPYIFAVSRFAHYLKAIVRDKIGSFKEKEDMERWLNNWIMNYVEPDPANASEEAKARRPLADAEVRIEENEDDPGYYRAFFYLRPHYQLEGLTVSLRLVSKLPSQKAGEAG
ncbi:MAG TPA: type VI secretion system contractile sheath large subunit [Thiotrichales bacterium]|nr:type VI secretion system contractile sheath large subunit [Thiotrichales bacterium]